MKSENEIILKAITYCYTEDCIPYNKVVGIFEKNSPKYLEALDDIRNLFKEYKLKNDSYDSSCDNYFIEYENLENLNTTENQYFYTSDYVLNELDI